MWGIFREYEILKYFFVTLMQFFIHFSSLSCMRFKKNIPGTKCQIARFECKNERVQKQEEKPKLQ